MTTKTRIAERGGYGENEVVVYEDETLNTTARLAFVLIEKWGMISCEADGEDSAGRQKVRLSTPTELVTRAFAVAEKAFQTAREKGYVVQLPDLNEINRDEDVEKMKRKASVAEMVSKPKAPPAVESAPLPPGVTEVVQKKAVATAPVPNGGDTGGVVQSGIAPRPAAAT